MNIKTLSELKCKPCSGETKNLSKDEISNIQKSQKIIQEHIDDKSDGLKQ